MIGRELKDILPSVPAPDEVMIVDVQCQPVSDTQGDLGVSATHALLQCLQAASNGLSKGGTQLAQICLHPTLHSQQLALNITHCWHVSQPIRIGAKHTSTPQGST